MNGLMLCILVIGSSVRCSVKKHDGPPLFIRDIYTNGKPDDGRDKLLTNILKQYPMLNKEEIVDCIEDCALIKDDIDIIAQCQELMLWKSANLSTIKDKKSCFKEYKKLSGSL